MAEKKRGDGDPRAIIEYIEWQRRGHEAAQRVRVHWPVRKEQIGPALSHDPRPIRKWPGPMGDVSRRVFSPEHAGQPASPALNPCGWRCWSFLTFASATAPNEIPNASAVTARHQSTSPSSSTN